MTHSNPPESRIIALQQASKTYTSIKKPLIMYKYHQIVFLEQISKPLNQLNADSGISSAITTKSPADTGSKKQHKLTHQH